MTNVRVNWPVLIVLAAAGLVGLAMVVTAPVVWQGIGLWLRDATGWAKTAGMPDGIGMCVGLGGVAQALMGIFGIAFACINSCEWKVVQHDG